jgi:hypothetical protein
MGYAIQVCRQLASRIRMELVCTSSILTKEFSETCRVSFQNKFEKLVHLVDFITSILYTLSFSISKYKRHYFF